MKQNSKLATALIFALSLLFALPVWGELINPGTDIEVIEVNDQQVEINQGKEYGVKTGLRLKLVRYEKVREGRFSVLDVWRVAEAEIIEVKEKSSIAKLLKTYRPIQKGDAAIFEPTEELPSTDSVVTKPVLDHLFEEETTSAPASAPEQTSGATPESKLKP